MNTLKVAVVTALAAGISIASVVLGERWLSQQREPVDGATPITTQIEILPDFRLPGIDGREIHSSSWAGKVLVLNYWASWCPPCLREIPMMVRTQAALQDRGVQIVAIAIDRPEDVKGFIAEVPLNFPVLIGNLASVELSRRLGNRLQGLPFTVIFDARGRRIVSHAGEITEAQLTQALDTALGATGGNAGSVPTSPEGAAVQPST